MMKYTESLTREELNNFVRFYLYRSRQFIGTMLSLVITIALGAGALFSGDRFVTGFFVFMMTLVMIGLVWATLAQFRTFRIYGQSQYPQEFDFTESAMSVTNANGIHHLIPWRHVRKIYAGNSYVYFATAIGQFWVHKERFADHLSVVTALWESNRPQKQKRSG